MPNDPHPPRTRTTAHWSDGNVSISGRRGPEPEPEQPEPDAEDDQPADPQ